MPHPAGRDLERRQLEHPVVAGEHALDAALQLVRHDRGQEADASIVHSDHRDAGAEEPREGTEHRPVPAEDDRDVRLLLAVDQLDPEALGE